MKKLFPLILLSIISISCLKAQSFSIGPQAGFVKASDRNESTFMPGLAARLKFIGFNIEGSIYYKSEEYLNGNVKTKSYPMMLTAMFNFLPIVHGEVGIGWYKTKVEYSSLYDSETTNDTGYHIGAGVELPLSNLILTGDIRYVFLNLKVNSDVSEIKSNFYAIMVGAMYRF